MAQMLVVSMYLCSPDFNQYFNISKFQYAYWGIFRNFKNSRFQDFDRAFSRFQDSKFQDFKVPIGAFFKISRFQDSYWGIFQDFKISRSLLGHFSRSLSGPPRTKIAHQADQQTFFKLSRFGPGQNLEILKTRLFL